MAPRSRRLALLVLAGAMMAHGPARATTGERPPVPPSRVSLNPVATVPPAPPPVPSPTPAEPRVDYTPVVLGAGAVAGVVGFNLLALGLEAVPLIGGPAEGIPLGAEMSVAWSRFYAVSSAVAGALVADYVYGR